MYLKDKAFKYPKNQSYFWQFQVKFHIYVDIGQDDEDDYDDGNLATKITVSNMMMKSMR